MSVLTHPASQRDFNDLLTPENIRDVTNNPEYFVPQEAPKLQFSSANVHGRDQTLKELIERLEARGWRRIGDEFWVGLVEEVSYHTGAVGKWKRTTGSQSDPEARPQKKRNNTGPVVLSDDLVES